MKQRFFRQLAGTILRPGRTFNTLAEHQRTAHGVGAIVLAGLVYSAFVAWMYVAGHRPSFTGVPIPAEHYYLWQAIFLPVWLLVAWGACVGVAHGVSRAMGSTAAPRATAAVLGYAIAVPLTAAYVVPEMVVFGVAGHGALVTAMRITGPITLVWWSVLVYVALRRVHGRSRLRTAAATAAALLAFIVVTAVLVR